MAEKYFSQYFTIIIEEQLKSIRMKDFERNPIQNLIMVEEKFHFKCSNAPQYFTVVEGYFQLKSTQALPKGPNFLADFWGPKSLTKKFLV